MKSVKLYSDLYCCLESLGHGMLLPEKKRWTRSNYNWCQLVMKMYRMGTRRLHRSCGYQSRSITFKILSQLIKFYDFPENYILLKVSITYLFTTVHNIYFIVLLKDCFEDNIFYLPSIDNMIQSRIYLCKFQDVYRFV